MGILHEIDSETSTVALEQVVSYGTEGRRGDPELELPPSDLTYDYIVFKGSDVKDLTVLSPAPGRNPCPAPNDPAIIEVSSSVVTSRLRRGPGALTMSPERERELPNVNS